MKARIRSNQFDKSREHSSFRDTLNDARVRQLSRKWIGANFLGVTAPILERRAGIDLKVIVADLARNVILPVVAVAFAAPSPVNEPHFSCVIDLIQRRTDHLTWQILSIGRSHLRLRIGSDAWLPDGRGSDIARSEIRHWK